MGGHGDNYGAVRCGAVRRRRDGRPRVLERFRDADTAPEFDAMHESSAPQGVR